MFSRVMSPRIDDIPRGFYQCHPRHMMTHKPLNIDDADLVDGMSRTGRPSSQPTTMSYALFRMRLCECSRSLVDRTSIVAINTDGPSHDVVMDIDTELQILLQEIPPYFSMSIAELTTTFNLEPSNAASIIRQGRILRSLFYGQRCKLHLPYLGRGYTDPRYAISRDACVQSARLVIHNEGDPSQAGLCATTNYQPLGLITTVFVGCVVLLMDLCHSKGSPHHEQQRAEFFKAFRLLEDAKNESTMAAKLIASMIQILHKNQITPPKVTLESCVTNPATSNISASPTTLSSTSDIYNAPGLPTPDGLSRSMEPNGNYGCQAGSGFFPTDMDLSYFPDIVQSLDQGMNIDNINWTDLFQDLETSFI
jgi:hypothetical protein